MHPTPTIAGCRGFAAWVAFLLQLLSSTPVFSLTTVAVAWVDGGHTIRLTGQSESYQVVLGHHFRSQREALQHHHCLLARGLVFFSEPASPREPDHVLTFSNQQPAASDSLAAHFLVMTEVSTAYPLCRELTWSLPPTIPRAIPLVTESPPPTRAVIFHCTVFQI